MDLQSLLPLASILLAVVLIATRGGGGEDEGGEDHPGDATADGGE